jgi:XTP/dITP diphosphohydrolase
MKLIFATNNGHKVQEVKAVLPPAICVVSLKEAGISRDIPEPHDSLEENAAEKARTIHGLTQTACFSEDTGLEVPSLNGEPGVRSARYAGEEATAEQNIQKLLRQLEGVTDRSARFRTVVFLILEGKEYSFEGICPGKITGQPSGSGGFGYDAVFIPEGAQKTFAEMTLAEKNSYSHRKKAMDKLVTFLNHFKTNEQI